MARIGRNAIKTLVLERDLDEILRLVDEGQGVLRRIRGLLFSEDDLLRERAAEAVGAVAGRLDGRKPKQIHTLVQGLLWSLNDESGMSGRGSPEALGRLLNELPDRDDDVIPILISYLDDPAIFLDDELLDAGLLVTLARLGSERVSMPERSLVRMVEFMRDSRPRLRGTAAHAAGRLGLTALREVLDSLREDRERFPLYQDGALSSPMVGQVAEEALARLEAGSEDR